MFYGPIVLRTKKYFLLIDMPKKYTKKHKKRHSKTCHRKNGNRNKSYSRKRVYGGNNSTMNKNRNEWGTTSNSIDGNPVSSNKKVVMALSSGYVGSGEEYKKHKEYINFQGDDY
jgi:hypothetical protein